MNSKQGKEEKVQKRKGYIKERSGLEGGKKLPFNSWRDDFGGYKFLIKRKKKRKKYFLKEKCI